MSNNLDLDQVAAAQNSKEVTINDQAGQIDAAMTDILVSTITSTNAKTLTNAEFRRYQFHQIDPDGGDPPTAAITITVPAIKRGLFSVFNNTAQTVTVTISAQSKTAPVIPVGEHQILTCDGTDVWPQEVALASRSINTNAPLTGGGDLSADRTLDINLATEGADGSIELATQGETDTGSDDTRAVTPLKLNNATTVVHPARAVNTNAPLTGGGDLSANRTLDVSDGTADGLLLHRIARATYDFTEHGGAISTIGLGVTIPDNALITRSWYEVITTLTSSTDAATVAIGLPVDDVGGIVVAIAISDVSNPWDQGLHEAIQDGTVANYTVKTTAAREISIDIAVEAVTAGKFILFCEYVVTE